MRRISSLDAQVSSSIAPPSSPNSSSSSPASVLALTSQVKRLEAALKAVTEEGAKKDGALRKYEMFYKVNWGQGRGGTAFLYLLKRDEWKRTLLI